MSASAITYSLSSLKGLKFVPIAERRTPRGICGKYFSETLRPGETRRTNTYSLDIA